MFEKKEEVVFASYTLGIISIVLAFFTPLAGLIFGIIGLTQTRKNKSDLARKCRKMNIIGIILSILVLIFSIVAAYFALKGVQNLGTFPLT